jgi:hypothetical protein
MDSATSSLAAVVILLWSSALQALWWIIKIYYITFKSLTLGGDADEDDINYCFDPVRDYFEELPC